ncbi:hypothetical protein R3P38DRAFT_2807974 [Favolaschia claudopus]|uniref:Uncharacterized protein n=1 Tax=Favolaschia claudopus TaxID=2862362 RepID=A0AAV9ZGU5_9AGAR
MYIQTRLRKSSILRCCPAASSTVTNHRMGNGHRDLRVISPYKAGGANCHSVTYVPRTLFLQAVWMYDSDSPQLYRNSQYTWYRRKSRNCGFPLCLQPARGIKRQTVKGLRSSVLHPISHQHSHPRPLSYHHNHDDGAYKKSGEGPKVFCFPPASQIVAAQAQRVASATYYQKNADVIREKRRIQMAEKRAQIKAKRRKSDKPRQPPKKNLKSAPLEPPFPQIPSPRILAEAESDASDALLTMARQPAQQPVSPPASPDPRMRANEPFDEEYDLIARANERDIDSEDSDDAEAGHRTISEVADAMACQGRSIEVGEDENMFLMHGGLRTPERERSLSLSLTSTRLPPQNRRRYSTPVREDSPAIDWDSEPRMPSFLDYMQEYLDRHRRRRVD